MTSLSNDRGSALHRGVLVLAVCTVAGLLLAGLAFPVVGGFGMLARAGAESFDQMPAELSDDPLPQRSKILAADGSTLADIYLNENRLLASIDQMPEDLLYAIVAIEDARFYAHGGIDVRGLGRALVRNSQAGGVQEGGSTITQQYVKNRLIESADDTDGKKAATERSATRKIREAKYAIALERRFTKRQILEKYLNIAYFGNGVYGVGTAAQFYFKKPVGKLTLAESALIAGMAKNPEVYNPVDNPRRAKARRDLVLRRMVEVGVVEEARARKAAATKVPKIVPQKLGDIEDNKIAPTFLRYMRDYFLADERFGDTVQERRIRLFQGGLVIQTTLDPKLQRVAQDTLNRTLPLRTDPAAAAVVVKPGTGEVKAMAVVNHDPKTAKVNLATGGSTGFQPGSTFKTFTLAAAVEQGIPLATRINSPARYRADPDVCDNPADGDFNNAGDSEAGNFDMPTATWMSVNTYYVQLQTKVGTDRVAGMARRLGIPLPQIPSRECSLTLGAREVSPLRMAAAYAAFAAQGTYCEPIPITSVTAPGEAPRVLAPECRQAVPPDVANTVTSVLTGVIDGKHPDRTGKTAALGRPAAGKTGTTNGPTAAWFDGYTPDFAAAVWMGHPTSPASNPLRWVHGVPIVYGGTFPAQMWREIMLAAHEGLPPAEFAKPSANAILGERVSVPDVRGMSPEAATAALQRAGLTGVVGSRSVSAGPIPAGMVGAQTPGTGRLVYKGSTVVLFLSNGRVPPYVPPPPVVVTATPTVPVTSPTPTPSYATLTPRSPTPTPAPTKSPECKGNKCPTPTPTPTAPPPSQGS